MQSLICWLQSILLLQEFSRLIKMKAFIAVLLVASAAAQMDVMDWKLRDNLKFKNIRSVEDLWMKEKMGGVYGYDRDMDWFNSFVGDRMTYDTMTLEEMVTLPIFREYMSMPLFRQFWEEHPIVFRRYLESPLFQKFWMMPEFMTYFRNPYMFAKFILPMIQFVQTVVPTTEGMYNYNYNLPYAYRHQNSEWTTPTIYGRMFNKSPFTATTNYKYILEKMMSHLNMKKDIETFGEKVFPEVYNKYDVDFEPFTYKNKMASPMITRMFKNKMMNKFVPKMDVMTAYKTEKMIEELKKIELITELTKNNEHSIFTPEMKFPTMFETEKMKYIPITINKPVIGGLEIFPRERQVEDIKF